MSNRTNGSVVRELEEAFAKYVGAKYAIACCNGTATLHTALAALIGHRETKVVLVPPLTMASTTLAVLHAGGIPRFHDVHPQTWLMDTVTTFEPAVMPVSLYGAWSGFSGERVIEDAAQTLNKHRGAAFTSYSFQASKILSAGEGGMLVTDSPELDYLARRFSRLGYRQGMWDEIGELKHPNAERHLCVGYNYRMSDAQAKLVLDQLPYADNLVRARQYSAQCYRQAIQGVDWIIPQYVPDGWPHSYWCYAIALKSPEMWEPFVAQIEAHGGERPYAAWRLTYQEPAFRHLAPDGTCPVAEDLQPRLVQLQTNHDRAGSERAAEILHKAIRACKF